MEFNVYEDYKYLVLAVVLIQSIFSKGNYFECSVYKIQTASCNSVGHENLLVTGHK